MYSYLLSIYFAVDSLNDIGLNCMRSFTYFLINATIHDPQLGEYKDAELQT